MLGLSDKRRLSRSLAAIGLVLGPLFFPARHADRSAGTVLGLTLLAVALLRQRLVALRSPILLIVASVFWHVAGGERVTDALALLMLAAALAPLAARMWSLSDEDWELWEIGM